MPVSISWWLIKEVALVVAEKSILWTDTGVDQNFQRDFGAVGPYEFRGNFSYGPMAPFAFFNGTFACFQGGSGTEPEPGTGTVGTVISRNRKRNRFFRRNRFPGNRNRNRPFLLNSTEPKKNLFCRGTAGTENRNRSNRCTPEP